MKTEKGIVFAALCTLMVLSALLIATPLYAEMCADLNANVEITGGGTSSAFVVGMNLSSSDDYDPAYDSFTSPGGMNDKYISSFSYHPEWGQVKDRYRMEYRAMAETQQWDITVETNLAAGTMLSLGFNGRRSWGTDAWQVTVTDHEASTTADLATGYSFAVPAGGLKTFTVSAAALQSCSVSMTLSGTILDQKNRAVSGADVFVKPVGKGNEYFSTTTDSSGRFTLSGMQKGTYKVSVRARGFRLSSNNHTVHMQNEDRDIVLYGKSY